MQERITVNCLKTVDWFHLKNTILYCQCSLERTPEYNLSLQVNRLMNDYEKLMFVVQIGYHALSIHAIENIW